MTFKRDYSCEKVGLIVLTALNAVSHFWYVMIAISILAGLVGVSGPVVLQSIEYLSASPIVQLESH